MHPQKQARPGKKKITFLGLSGYDYPHTRVRCYHFQREVDRREGINSEVLSWKDHLGPQYSEAKMYQLTDRQKLDLRVLFSSPPI